MFIISYHVTKFYFNQFLAPYSTISPHLTTTTTPDHFITTFLQCCSPRLSQEQWTQMINYLHILHCENKNCGKSIFPFSIYLQSTMNLDLPNDDGLEQSSMLSSTQLHIPYRESKKCMKAKSTFFTFDLCSYTMNMYYENENPASEPHPFYFNHPLSLSYPCLTPILMLVFEFQNAGFKHECRTRMFNPWNKDLKLPDLKMSDSHIQPMELQL